MLIHIKENEFEFIIRDICDADQFHFDKLEFTLGDLELFYKLVDKLK